MTKRGRPPKYESRTTPTMIAFPQNIRAILEQESETQTRGNMTEYLCSLLMMQRREDVQELYSQIETLKSTLKKFMKDNSEKAQEIQNLVSKFFTTKSIFQEVSNIDDVLFSEFIEQERDKLQNLKQRYVIEGGTRPEEVVQKFFEDSWKNFVFFCDIRAKKITDEKSAKIILKNKIVLFMKEKEIKVMEANSDV